MPEIDRLTLRIEADASQAERSLARLESRLTQSNRALSRVSSQVGRSVTPPGVAPDDSGMSLSEQTRELQELQQRLSDASQSLGQSFASAFARGAIEGRRLSDVLQGLERDVLRFFTRRLVTEPLAGAFAGLIGAGGASFASLFHLGGHVGAGPTLARLVPSALFAGAERFAGGGLVGRVPRLAPGEVPAILHRGEVVRTAAQEAALRRNASGSGETRIIVNIQTPDPRAFNESRGQIQAMLADAVHAGRRNR